MHVCSKSREEHRLDGQTVASMVRDKTYLSMFAGKGELTSLYFIFIIKQHYGNGLKKTKTKTLQPQTSLEKRIY
jgi:hypothetical protein